jgi:WD40 repeat protein
LGLALAATVMAGRAAPPDQRGEPSDGAALARLIEQLGSASYGERQEASKRLDDIGEPALPLLYKAAHSDDLEVRFRARDLVWSIQHRLYGQRRALLGHRDVVVGIAVSADGTRVLSGSNDGTIRLWDLTTGASLRRMEGHRGQAWAVALSPDGKLALGGGQDGGLALYDAATGKQVRTFERHPQAVRAVLFTPDGKRALSACYDHILRLWDVKTGKKLHSFVGHKDSIMCLACSPDGKRALTGGLDSDRTVRLWNLETGEELRQLVGHGERIMGVDFSPDGRLAASAAWDATVRLWDLQTGKEIRRFPDPHGRAEAGRKAPRLAAQKAHVYGVAFSPDGKYLVSGDESGELFLWDVATGKHLFSYEGHSGYISAVAFSRQGRHLVSCGGDHAVRVWLAPR